MLVSLIKISILAGTNTVAGSGCIAALEAEKWLAEQDGGVEDTLDTETEAKKPQENGSAPEYRSNPLL